MDKKINLEFGDKYRIYTLGDIHGNKQSLVDAVEKMDLLEDDYLVIIGDIINRGPQSLEALDFVMELQEKHKRTIVLSGNHEMFTTIGFDEKQENFYEFYKTNKYRTILNDMLDNEGIVITDENFKETFKILLEKYHIYFEYMRNLPIILETEDHIFVHSAYKEGVDVNTDPFLFLKEDKYFEDKTVNAKKVIVGHMPSGIFETGKFTSSPYYDEVCNRIFIDGGCGVKSSGEINTLVISKDYEINYSHFQTNCFDEFVIRDTYYFEERESVVIRYPNFEVEVLEKGEIFSRCIYKFNNKECYIFNDFIREYNGVQLCWYEYTDKRFNIEAGEVVEFVSSYEDMAFVKYREEFGWIYLDQIMGD